jgi:hypothetical protein
MDAVLDRFSEFWETLLSMLPDGLQSWSPPALERMQLAPHGFEGNPLMVRLPSYSGRSLANDVALTLAARFHVGREA